MRVLEKSKLVEIGADELAERAGCAVAELEKCVRLGWLSPVMGGEFMGSKIEYRFLLEWPGDLPEIQRRIASLRRAREAGHIPS